MCHANPAERSRFIRCIYNLLNSSSPAVRYEAAGTLVTLSSAPTAVKVILNNNIKLIQIVIFEFVGRQIRFQMKGITSTCGYFEHVWGLSGICVFRF